MALQAALVLLLLVGHADASAPAPSAHPHHPWMTTLRAAPAVDRAKMVLGKMTLAEKLVMLHGNAVGGTECFNKTTGKIIGAYCACACSTSALRLRGHSQLSLLLFMQALTAGAASAKTALMTRFLEWFALL